MFSGIIDHVGKITQSHGAHIWVSTSLTNIKIGDSIAINGVCLTVEEILSDTVCFTLGHETMELTNLGSEQVFVNVEPSLKIGDPLGGHMVQGHVLGMTTLLAKTQHENSWTFRFEKPCDMELYIVKKGYVTLDGVSLTVTYEDKNVFEVMVIPYTYHHTVFQYYEVGSKINIETDIIGRYVEKIYSSSR
jgi:riboflavin synthase